jgi:hypothetical protein
MKCGAKLEEGIGTCSSCGTPVGMKERTHESAQEGAQDSGQMSPQEGPPPETRADRSSRTFLAIAVIFLGIAIIITALFVMPIRQENVSESKNVAYQDGVDKIDLDFTAANAQVDIAFEDLPDDFITLDVSGTIGVGVFGSSAGFNLIFEDDVQGNVLAVTSEIKTNPGLQVVQLDCTIRIDTSLKADLNLITSSGGIVLNTQPGVVLDSANLQVTSGNVKADLDQGVNVTGDVSLRTTSGNVEFSWDNTNATSDIQVDLGTTSGNIRADVKQNTQLSGNIILKAITTNGNVNFDIDIQGDIGAWIESKVTSGNINVNKESGFKGIDSLVLSDNHPAGSNFDVNLETTSGNINLNAAYVP